MKKLFNIYDGKTLIKSLFADSCEPALSGRGVFLEGCTDMVGARVTVDKTNLTVVENVNRNRALISAYLEAYHQGKRGDRHSHFAEILCCSREEAKDTSYEILYRGCSEFIRVHG